MESVTIQIGATWASIARSPVYWIIAALQGVSVTFAPLFLYWSGRGGYSLGYEWVVVPVCLAVMYLVPLFFIFSSVTASSRNYAADYQLQVATQSTHGKE